MGELQSLVGICDCFGWVPTIRGSLSLDLINDANEILGDVDKYSVEVKNYKNLRSEHYIAATSLLTVNDILKREKTFCVLSVISLSEQSMNRRGATDTLRNII